MSDSSPVFGRPGDPRLLAHVDVDGKLLQALAAVARPGDADVVLVDVDADRLARGLAALGGRVTAVADPACVDEVAALMSASPVGSPNVAATIGGLATSLPLPDASADVLVGAWSVYRGIDPAEIAEADRVLRPGGRHLVVHDYGRDDMARLTDPDRPEVVEWSRRGGPFLRAGFKIRVVHCWCTFDTLEEAEAALGSTFGQPGRDLARAMKRPRLSYNLAIYHRVRPEHTR